MLCRNRHKALFLGAALLLGGCIEVPAPLLLNDRLESVSEPCQYPSPVEYRPLPARFTLLSWNIYKQQGDWRSELDDWAADAELLLLQEASGTEALHHWLQERGYRWFQVPAFNWRGAPQGVLTAAPGEALQACGQRVVEPMTRVPKSQLFSRYQLTGEPEQLLVVNLHAINFSLRGRSYQEQLERISDVIGDYRGPVIVAGDFNRWNARRDRLLRHWAEREQLQEMTLAEDNRTRFAGYPLDSVFYRGLQLEQARSMTSTASDHGPIKAVFRVLGEA
ncbi:endonuclease/exonuclease/phosphatase family protein [Zobellella sp. DQSA1]|uniref:endonuclease/exonuclease/phosphatase family protein n=1 Tax=Zobellella sp. DQSA1 TaxID=3342386 RepID=UPI0035BFEDB9